MKTYFKQKLIFIFLLCISQFNLVFSQQTWICGGVEMPSTAGNLNNSASCSMNSSTWLNKYYKVSTYIPQSNSPSQILGINFIIFQDSSGGNNFTNSDIPSLNLIFNWLRDKYRYNDPPSDRISGVVESTSKNVDFILEGIYFYKSSTLNTSTNGSSMIQYLQQNDSLNLKYLNIFFTEGGSGWAHSTRGALYNSNSNLWINMLGVNTGGPLSYYASSTTLAHEMGHILDLCHTYLGGGCATTLSAMGTNPDDGDWFDDVFGNPYPGNAPHLLPDLTHPWDFNVALSSNDRRTNNLLGGFQAESYLSPLQIGKIHRALALKTARRYLVDCVYDVNNPWNIITNEDWDFDINWDKDIDIQSGATVNLNCKLSMPQTSSITIESGAILNIDGVVTNNCDSGWNGTIHVKPGGILNLKANADITFIGNGKILIDDDATNPGLLTIDGIPKVNLNGINTMIDIRGKVEIKNNSTFKFFHHSNNTNFGFIKFANTSLNPSRNITAGSNSNIDFTGVTRSKKILEIDQETFYAPTSIVNFTISSGTVELAANSRIQPEGLTTVINLYNALFTSNTLGVNNGHRGVSLLGQPSVTVSNCVFEYGYTGINAFLTAGGNNLNIDNCTFNNNYDGLLINDKGCNITSCFFINNVIGFNGGYMSYPSVMTNCYFTGNSSIGCYWINYSNASLTITGADIRFNTGTGVKVHGAPLIISCSNISNNNIGIDVQYGATLTMNNYAKVISTGNSNYTIRSQQANNFYLTNGHNDLTPAVANSQRDIFGTVILNSPVPPAHANKWNTLGNFTSNDYYLYDLNVGPVTLTDASPLNVAPPCGVVDPCPNPPCDVIGDPPCKHPPCEQVEFDALLYCPDCGTINTPDFQDKKLNDAISKAIDKVYSHESQNYSKAVKLFSQILKVNYSNPNKRESYLLNLGYLKLQESLGYAFLYKQINTSRTLADEVQTIIDIENSLIDKAHQQKNYYRKLLYSMDKAQTYRIANRRDLTLNILNTMLSWVQTDDLDIVNNFICIVNTEKDAIEGHIGLASIVESLKQCNQTYQFRLAEPSNNEKETKISIFPNPITDIVNIETSIENAHVILFDNVGQLMVNKKMNYDTNIDLSSFAKGIYILKIENLITSERWIRKIVVQ